jgi:hypothetical protein
MPETKERKKLYLSPLPLRAKKRGKSPTQPRNPKSNPGNEKTRRRDEEKIKKKSFR